MSFTLLLDPDDLSGQPWDAVLRIRLAYETDDPVGTTGGLLLKGGETRLELPETGTFSVQLPDASEIANHPGFRVRYGSMASVPLPAQSANTTVNFGTYVQNPEETPPTQDAVKRLDARNDEQDFEIGELGDRLEVIEDDLGDDGLSFALFYKNAKV